VFIRTDIPLAQQIVQANHATLHAGLLAGQSGHSYKQTPSIVLLQISNETKLLQAHERITSAGITCALFHEPDDDLGYVPSHTAFATIPVTEEHRAEFRQYKLWRSPL
jgi:peptidyl-tRNA hydrolase